MKNKTFKVDLLEVLVGHEGGDVKYHPPSFSRTVISVNTSCKYVNMYVEKATCNTS